MRVPLTRCLLGSLRTQPGQARTLFTLSDHSKKPETVPLTKDSFKELRRGDFAEATPEDLSKLKELVKGRIETDKDDLLKYSCDWMRTLRGACRVCGSSGFDGYTMPVFFVYWLCIMGRFIHGKIYFSALSLIVLLLMTFCMIYRSYQICIALIRHAVTS